MNYPQEEIKPYSQSGKKSEQVEVMFDHIAPAYDKLNHGLSKDDGNSDRYYESK